MASGFTIVGLGEALWDLLPSGKQLGGAPLNVACHAGRVLSEHGGSGVVASRIGDDSLGEELLGEFHARGLTAEYVQRDGNHPTGIVNVELDHGQPTYEIVEDVAWDLLQFTPEWAKLAADCSAVCFGSLAQRTAVSRDTIWRFLDAAPHAIRLFDVNLRQEFYSQKVLHESLRRATVAKLNEHELPVLAESLNLATAAQEDRLAELRAEYELDALVLTRGERGTMLITGQGIVSPPAVSYPPEPNADSVGAGDACSAGIIAGWLLSMRPVETAELANHLGAFVASQSGATPELPQAILDKVVTR